jgi:DNA-binding Lrp family transcriptional regulator
MSKNFEFDKFDRALLSLIQKNNRISAEAMGTDIGLSTASVQRRIKRLRDAGVITADVSIVDRSLLGYHIQLLVHVEMERDSKQSIGSFRKALAVHECVQHSFYVTGQYDFILIVIARDMSHYESIADELFLHSDEVKAFTTSVVMGESEQSLFVPVS